MSGRRFRGRWPDQTDEEYLLSRVEFVPDAGCWLWSGTLTSTGYGHCGRQSLPPKAHRAFWKVFRGEPGDSYVLHKCDTPACCNPDHLWLGTAADNMADAARKGRNGMQTKPWTSYFNQNKDMEREKGEQRYNAKMTDEKVRLLRAMKAQGVSFSKLSRLFGIGYTNTTKIVRRQAWKHVD